MPDDPREFAEFAELAELRGQLPHTVHAIHDDVRRRLYALEAKDNQLDSAIRALERSVDGLSIRIGGVSDHLDSMHETFQASMSRFENRFDEHTREERAHWTVEQQYRIERETRERERQDDAARRERELQIESRRARRNEIIAMVGIVATLIATIAGSLIALKPGL